MITALTIVILVLIYMIFLLVLHIYKLSTCIQRNIDTLSGLWVTDRPDLVPNKAKDKYYWELKAEHFIK